MDSGDKMFNIKRFENENVKKIWKRTCFFLIAIKSSIIYVLD